jgi:hypothetical protein
VPSSNGGRAPLSSTVRPPVNAQVETVSLEEAIARGHRFVNYPVFALLAAPAVLLITLGKRFEDILGTQFTARLEIAFFVVCFCGAWLWWSYAVPRWRLWAYQRVEDIQSLKRLAIEQKLVWPDGSIFERTEIKSKAHAAQERALESAKGAGPAA